MAQTELEWKGPDLCSKEFSNKHQRKGLRFSISFMLNLNNSMGYIPMQFKFMIEWLIMCLNNRDMKLITFI